MHACNPGNTAASLSVLFPASCYLTIHCQNPAPPPTEMNSHQFRPKMAWLPTRFSAAATTSRPLPCSEVTLPAPGEEEGEPPSLSLLPSVLPLPLLPLPLLLLPSVLPPPLLLLLPDGENPAPSNEPSSPLSLKLLLLVSSSLPSGPASATAIMT